MPTAPLPLPGELGIRQQVRPDWWRGFFGPDYLLMYATDLAPRRSAREAECAIRALRLRAGARVLDLCCGFGRHLPTLRAHGLVAIGVEQSAYQIGVAKGADANHGVRPPIAKGDARLLPFGPVFDAVLCMYTSIGYLDAEGDARHMREAARVLKPGGLLYLDNQNPEHILRRLAPSRQVTEPFSGLQIVEEFEFDPKARRIYGRKTIMAPSGPRELCFAMRAYSAEELAGLLEKAGLQRVLLLGDYDLAPFSQDCPRIILAARKG